MASRVCMTMLADPWRAGSGASSSLAARSSTGCSSRRAVRSTSGRSWCFFSSRRRHTRFDCDWSSDVCSSDLLAVGGFYGTKLILKGSAERKIERERQFGVATNAGGAAYRAGNLSNAIAEADKALAIHGNDAGIRKLKADELAQQTAAAQQAERERQFGVATNAGWAAYRAGYLTNAIAEADKALAIHGDDAGIRKLKADALARQTAAAQQAERERQFGAATNAAWAAYRAGNLTIAIAEADEALAIHEEIGRASWRGRV